MPWIAAVTGHHGIIPNSTRWVEPSVEHPVFKHDNQARLEWVNNLLNLFLGNDLYNIPVFQPNAVAVIAGLCSVSDWIASNELFVRWELKPYKLEPEEYFKGAKEHCRILDILTKFGITGRQITKFEGIRSLLPDKREPQQIQTLIDELPIENGLTIIEGTTGSGKTEAALALAWKLIDAGQADSIIFALPTQATADAILDRLQKLAPLLFKSCDSNLVLAHGKAQYNPAFADLKAAGRMDAKKINQGTVQCAEWITSSRKLVFLGQIGVCTIDQVLLSVLPVKHNFIRSLGVMKSVLIIDEVHAYDRYMYGLLEEVLKHQKATGGNAILLSATLPAVQKQELFETWHKGCGTGINPDSPYPLVSRLSVSGSLIIKTVDNNNLPPNRNVAIEIVLSKDMEPIDATIKKMLDAAQNGATIAMVCNLVYVAQKIARNLSKSANIPVDIFHARYRFKDRQIKESAAKNLYGKSAPRSSGRILIATQVIEQSLDLDFDWLLTQLCPVDLLFQRMGRLHRHERIRPIGFEKPFCTIFTNESNDFGAHEKIYGDARILWRTRELIKRAPGSISFPEAYRKWIELVYSRVWWDEEPDVVIGRSLQFRQEQEQKWRNAISLVNTGVNPWADTDQNAASLTRGKEMGLNLVPIQNGQAGKILLDGECLIDVNEFEKGELLNMNAIPVPSNWKDWLPRFEDNYIFLPMIHGDNGWIWQNGKYSLRYTTDYGLERMEDNG
jgi:CRISPR-associated endonuclease/helicase Cas3